MAAFAPAIAPANWNNPAWVLGFATGTNIL